LAFAGRGGGFYGEVLEINTESTLTRSFRACRHRQPTGSPDLVDAGRFRQFASRLLRCGA
jgi:hypothetical protein